MSAVIKPTDTDLEFSAVASALNAIAAESPGNVLIPEKVVEHASDENSPLHKYFEWNDGKAAIEYRLAQAGALIRRIKITIIRPEAEDPKVIDMTVVRAPRMEASTVRKYASPKGERKSPDNPDGGYSTITDVLSDPARMADMLETALSELRALREKYQVLSELAGVWAAIDKV